MPSDEATLARVAPYVAASSGPVLVLSGLPEEALAVLFAYHERSPEDAVAALGRLAADASLETGPPASTVPAPPSAHASAFHRRWMDGAPPGATEHAVLHVVVEAMSLVAATALFDVRAGSWSEKDTRYAVFAEDAHADVPELQGEASETYRTAVRGLLSARAELLARAENALRERTAERGQGTDEEANEAIRLRAAALLRGLLPGGARTSVAFTANARVLEGLVRKALSHPLGEVQRLGGAIRDVATKALPTTFKSSGPSSFRAGLGEAIEREVRLIYTPPEEGGNATMVVSQPVRVVRSDKDALERIALALAYEDSDPRAHALGLLDGLRHASTSELAIVAQKAAAGRGPGEALPRGYEASSMTFELMMDLGTYRELARHRLISAAAQRAGCGLGFETPSDLADLGLDGAYQDAMLGAHQAWGKLERTHPREAQYVVPLGYRVRALWTLNLRELVHVIESRSTKEEHPNGRRIAQGLHRSACSVHPWLRELIRADFG